MKIDEIPVSWNREKVSVRAGLRLHSDFSDMMTNTMIDEIYKILN